MNIKKLNIRKKNSYSRFFGFSARKIKQKKFLNFCINKYINRYDINLDDYIIPENGFQNFNEFFTRKIKPELRPIGEGIVSPVDGFVYDKGLITENKTIFVKGNHYKFEELAKDPSLVHKSYCVLYLSPSNYHRVHAPFDLYINSIKYIPGSLFSVNEKILKQKANVYCRNERILVRGNSDYGDFVIVFVGATNVGKIKIHCEKRVKTNKWFAKIRNFSYDSPILVKKGSELGLFEVGSTVILFLDNEILNNICLEIDEEVKMGETLIETYQK